MTESDTSNTRKHRVAQCIIIISSRSSASSRKQCPSVAKQQLHSWPGNQMMKPESPFCEWCSPRSALLTAQIMFPIQFVGFLYYSENPK
ncbi:hypothetical protein CEXT_521851 [Caerostris extrusa]|uniref:Uncharacterized protein n=1 Tax=Caerostris extrusa TaxID=172846 RepID=A0AAV4Y057_CAEEX|nr:hypothetical protein CEXT_521851 [Caerostris extrusa]